MTDQDPRSLGTRVQRRIALGRLFALPDALRVGDEGGPPPSDEPPTDPHPPKARGHRGESRGRG